jgi:uncharacterized membrane protein
MSVAGAVAVVAGVVTCRRKLTGGSVADRGVALGRMLVGAPLAVFGAQHLAAPHDLVPLVPKYMPGPLFWVYLIGFALFATALSLIFDRAVRWSGILCGGMFWLFVAMMDLPALTTMLHTRFGQALLVRETAFGCGLVALGVSVGALSSGSSRVVAACRIAFGAIAMFYGFEHFLHPEFLPGVPLEKQIPAWEPVIRPWGYVIGSFLFICGAFLVFNRSAKKAGAWLGIAIAIAVLVVYLPLLGPAHSTDEMVEALDYIFDTMLYAGTALILAEAVSRTQATSHPVAASASPSPKSAQITA